MKTFILHWRRMALAVVLVSLPLAGMAAGYELITARTAELEPSASANGESGMAIITPDGRYVLFASTADNLVLTTNNSPVSGAVPPCLNVFLRDRTNGTTKLVSVNLAATGGGNGDSLPTGISTNGRYALFESMATNLVAGDTNNVADIFIRDMVSNKTVLVSTGYNGGGGNGISRSSVMTPDGRYVAFVSAATNLVANDTNGLADVFVRDWTNGVTTLISVGAQATYTGLPYMPTNSSESPCISADGRYVVFYSTATNLVPGVTTISDIYVRDRLGGTTVCASAGARTIYQLVTGSTNAVAYNHTISADGAYVAFEISTNSAVATVSPWRAYTYGPGMIFRYKCQGGLIDIVNANAYAPPQPLESVHTLDITPDGRFIAFVANAGTNWIPAAVFLWDAQSGLSTLVSGDSNNQMPTNGMPTRGCYSPVVDPTGQYVAFVSSATNLTTNVLAGDFHLYVRNVSAGTTTLVNVDTNGVGWGVDPTLAPGFAAGGNLVVFDCPESRLNTNDYKRTGNLLVTNDYNHADDVFVRNLAAGTTELISVRDANRPGQTANGPSGLTSYSVSSDGRYVAFVSEADNLTANDTNQYWDVYVRDRVAGTNILVSVGLDGFAGNGNSTEPAISGNGRYVAFTSYATNLVTGDGNKVQDVFVRDLQAGTTVLASASTTGGFGNGYSYSPGISTDGRYVLFRSTANNLASGSFSSENLFLRDMNAGTNGALTTAGCGSYSYMTPDGRYIAFYTSPNLYVWDTQLAKKIFTNSSTSYPVGVSLSPDGHRLAYIMPTPVRINLADLITGTNFLVCTNAAFGYHMGLQFSGDGRFLAYATTATNAATDVNATWDVYLFDCQAGTNFLVSRGYGISGPPGGASDSPVISPDGRFVAYRSMASNCVPGDFNEVPDLFLYDRLNGATTALSLNPSGTNTANNRSSGPMFSGDGQTLVFLSWASDLLAGDYNGGGDLLALNLSAPVITDSDGDGMDDQWELDNFGTLARDGTGDYDGDGATDLFEFRTGTNPKDRTSVFRATIVYAGPAGQEPMITWPLAPGKFYRVQFRDSLTDAGWQDLSGNVVLMDGTGYATDLAPDTGQRLYRIVLEDN
jgi:Tol biopolymer transport system component